MAYDGTGDACALRSDLRRCLGDLTLEIGDDGAEADPFQGWPELEEPDEEVAEAQRGIGYQDDWA